MLYDILIIDDDFDEGNANNQNNANTLLRDFIKDNLRVTWTTGEQEDLDTLKEKDLSTIQYIFLDLHLGGIKERDNIKTINSKIISIFRAINACIRSEQVICYINSQFTKGYGDEGIQDLQDKFNKDFSQKYPLKKIETKNQLSSKQKNKLHKNNLDIYCQSLIISQAIKVEKIFDKKLNLSKTAKENIDFYSKFLVFQSQKLSKQEKDKELKRQIQLLQQIRNKLAHDNENLSQITEKEMQKTFWQITKSKGLEELIKFKDFEHLIEYIKSIDCLCDTLEKIEQKNNT